MFFGARLTEILFLNVHSDDQAAHTSSFRRRQDAGDREVDSSALDFPCYDPIGVQPNRIFGPSFDGYLDGPADKLSRYCAILRPGLAKMH